MSGFTKNVTKEFEFDGDKVSVTFSRMKVHEFRLITDSMEIGQDGAPTGKISFDDQIAMMEKAADILPNRVVSMSGLLDADGNELTFDEIADEQYFIGLIGDIFQAVMEASVVTDPKKQSGKSGERSKASRKQAGKKAG